MVGTTLPGSTTLQEFAFPMEATLEALADEILDNLKQEWATVSFESDIGTEVKKTDLLKDHRRLLIHPGQPIDAIDCVIEAIQLDQQNVLAWSHLVKFLGDEDVVKINGHMLSKLDCI